jgi:hypothetical protein
VGLHAPEWQARACGSRACACRRSGAGATKQVCRCAVAARCSAGWRVDTAGGCGVGEGRGASGLVAAPSPCAKCGRVVRAWRLRLPYVPYTLRRQAVWHRSLLLDAGSAARLGPPRTCCAPLTSPAGGALGRTPAAGGPFCAGPRPGSGAGAENTHKLHRALPQALLPLQGRVGAAGIFATCGHRRVRAAAAGLHQRHGPCDCGAARFLDRVRRSGARRASRPRRTPRVWRGAFRFAGNYPQGPSTHRYGL